MSGLLLGVVVIIIIIIVIIVAIIIIIIIILIYSCLLVIRWWSFSKFRSQQEIRAIDSSTLWLMFTVIISVIFCISLADGWPGSNWMFWSNPFLIVPSASIITRTIFVLTFHILLTLISRSLFLLSFSVSLVLRFESSGMAISISWQVFSFYRAVLYQVSSLVLFDLCNWYVPHNSGNTDIYDPFR